MTDQTKYIAKIADYKKALAQDPKSMVFVPLADCYQRCGMLDDALETALKGTWELPDYTPGFVAVGRIYALRQAPEKAIEFFRKAIDLDPSSLDAYKGLARIYREQGDIDAAVKLLTNAVFLFPGEPSLKLMLESLTPAVSTSSVTQIPPRSAQDAGSKTITTATIAEIYIKQGFYGKALDVYRELYAKTKSLEVAQKIAEIEMLAQAEVVKVSAPAPITTPVPPPAVAPVPVATSDNAVLSSAQTVLDTFNGMLASIQLRRNRV